MFYKNNINIHECSSFNHVTSLVNKNVGYFFHKAHQFVSTRVWTSWTL